MTDKLPSPLTPADCDLRSVPSMLLDVQRFRDSDLVVLEDPEAVLAAILLWGAAWHQVPAASLPDDDRMLAQLAGYGKVVKAWKKVREGALRGFVMCSDGRLYHPVVAEKARDMWDDKLRKRHATLLATIRKHNERYPNNRLDGPTFEQWTKLGRPEKIAQLIEAAPATPGPLFDQSGENVACDNSDLSRDRAANVTRETASNRTELNRTELKKKETEVSGQANPQHSNSNAEPTRANGFETPTAALCFNEVCAAASWHPPDDSARMDALSTLDRWLLAGFDLHRDILAGIGKARRKRPSEVTRTLKRFESTIKGIHEDRTGQKADLSAVALSAAEITRRTAQSLSVGEGRR
ncbi:MAG TPA: hypothetical protein VFJ46_17615 [Xanthobacteraceae bacterium]|nr:hypothetical protein [Xanthobacteraceae bacterium]